MLTPVLYLSGLRLVPKYFVVYYSDENKITSRSHLLKSYDFQRVCSHLHATPTKVYFISFLILFYFHFISNNLLESTQYDSAVVVIEQKASNTSKAPYKHKVYPSGDWRSILPSNLRFELLQASGFDKYQCTCTP